MSRIQSALVRAILENWQDYEWSIQGFGFARTKLGIEGRIHVWDQRLRVGLVSDVHEHPWPLRSTIISGMLVNHKFYVHKRTNDGNEEAHDSCLPYVRHALLTGEGGGLCADAKPELVWLEPGAPQYHLHGHSYAQVPEEVHRTLAEDGTVTLMERPLGPPLQRTNVYWPRGTHWVSAEPRLPEDGELDSIMETALARWHT
jgi:hypothetical protein